MSLLAETINYSQFRDRLSDCLKACNKKGRRFLVVRNGEEEAMVVSAAEWNSICETLEIMNDPQLMKQLLASDKAIRAKRTRSASDVFSDLLAEEK